MYIREIHSLNQNSLTYSHTANVQNLVNKEQCSKARAGTSCVSVLDERARRGRRAPDPRTPLRVAMVTADRCGRDAPGIQFNIHVQGSLLLSRATAIKRNVVPIS